MSTETSYRGAEREKIPSEFKWNLKDIYPSNEAWKGEKEALEARISSVANFRHSLDLSPLYLFEALEFFFRLKKDILRFLSYASLLSDQDTRQPLPLSMKQEASHLKTKLDSAASFIAPELLRIPKKKLDDFIIKEPKLAIYSQFIDDTVRRKAHTLPEKGERLVAEAQLMTETAQEIHRILINAELPFQTVRLSDGNEVKIDASNYVLYRESKNREDRKAVFDAFFSSLKGYERTLGTALYGELKKNLFFKNARKHNSCLESSLFKNNIPPSVYLSLIENINSNLPALHRYLKLKKQLLKLDNLCYYDLYAPMVKESQTSYTFGDAKKLILAAVSVFGKEYLEVMEQAFGLRWIDVYPSAGKLSGAYMEGEVYDIHPYILTNFNGRYDAVSTLAHELGHATHSSFSNRSQLFVNSRYPIFLAEVASTVNEALLVDYVIKRVEDKAEQVSLLGGYLEGFRTTLFRQTQFAEFEMRIHDSVEQGEAYTGEDFTRVYLDILKKYYGHSEGVCSIDEPYGIEWAYIPHFFYNFYVFQYSTSFTASQAITSRILDGDKEIVSKYLQFLKSGCSDYPIPTLRRMGIDMESADPFKMTMRRMDGIITEIEHLTRY